MNVENAIAYYRSLFKSLSWFSTLTITLAERQNVNQPAWVEWYIQLHGREFLRFGETTKSVDIIECAMIEYPNGPIILTFKIEVTHV